ncbi:hypothetical protein GGU11DRAFT_751776 [Lentinula aff. detonsa]|nr:hypothetical protein GGU11DRAFT_751776 [Lentinula aff. detonsa]
MASEVIAGRYLVRFTSNSDLEDPAQIIGTGSIIKPPFAYNPLHDMESIRKARAVKALKSFNQSEGQTLDRQQFLQNYDKKPACHHHSSLWLILRAPLRQSFMRAIVNSRPTSS